RVLDAIKAAVDPLSIGSVGTVLSPFQTLAQAFLNSIVGQSAFDTMLPSMMRLPLRTRVISVTSAATGVALAESDVKRISSLQLSASDLLINKTAATIALTKETLVAGGDGVLQFLEAELRSAVSIATDTQFLSLITAGAPSIPAHGGNAN